MTLPKNAGASRLWMAAGAWSLVQTGVVGVVLARASETGAIARSVGAVELVVYGIVLGLLNAAGLFAYARSGPLGRGVALGVAVLGTLASVASAPPARPTLAPWQLVGVVLLGLTYSGVAFALARGVARLVAWILRRAPDVSGVDRP